MPRKILFDSREFPYHINAKANNREPFPGDLEFIWKVLTDELYLQTVLHGVQVHAFVLMPNHFHLLITTPNIEICKSMKEFLGSSTRIINTKYRRWGRIFGGRYHWSVIRNPIYYAHALKYVYRNPVRASLCETVSNYPFSTFSKLNGAGYLPIPILRPQQNMDKYVPYFKETFIPSESWMEQAHKEKELLAIKKALKRRSFELLANRSNRKKIILEVPTLTEESDAPPSPFYVGHEMAGQEGLEPTTL